MDHCTMASVVLNLVRLLSSEHLVAELVESLQPACMEDPGPGVTVVAELQVLENFCDSTHCPEYMTDFSAYQVSVNGVTETLGHTDFSKFHNFNSLMNVIAASAVGKPSAIVMVEGPPTVESIA